MNSAKFNAKTSTATRADTAVNVEKSRGLGEGAQKIIISAKNAAVSQNTANLAEIKNYSDLVYQNTLKRVNSGAGVNWALKSRRILYWSSGAMNSACDFGLAANKFSW